MTNGSALDRADRLNIAETAVADGTLGPGRRAVVWVQGCPFTCAGCIAPDWIPNRPARDADPAELARELLAGPGIDGLTLSGGEPMAQAKGLAQLVRAGRADRPELSVVCFTGYRLERLRGPRAPSGAADLLGEVDVLIDGLYVAARNDGRGLRGSSNQRVHHLTPRLADAGYDFATRPRTAHVRVADDHLLIIGVPPAGLLDAVRDALGGPQRPGRATEEEVSA